MVDLFLSTFKTKPLVVRMFYYYAHKVAENAETHNSLSGTPGLLYQN